MHRPVVSLLLFLFTGLILLQTGSHTAAQTAAYTIESLSEPYSCPSMDGEYFQPGVFPRYDATQNALQLVNADDQVVRTLDTFSENLRIINWSPDCRYLSGAVGWIRAFYESVDSLDEDALVAWNSYSIALWDTITGGRVATISDNTRFGFPDYLAYHVSPVQWSPDSRYALILAGCHRVVISCAFERVQRDWLWDSASNAVYRLAHNPAAESGMSNRARFNQVTWDLNREWVIGSGVNEAIAYDLTSGAEVRTFPAGTRTNLDEVLVAYSTDRQWLIAYRLYRADGAIPGLTDGIVVHSLTTGESIAVNAQGFGAQIMPQNSQQQVALSADNRYLIAGYHVIRVWDLHNLAAEGQPIYRYAGPDALIQSLRFAADDVIETLSLDGVQRWDLHTGTLIPN